MTITPTAGITSPGSIPPYVYGYQPYTNITPFTYRDGLTFLELTEAFLLYLNNTLIPFINNNFSEFDDEFTADMNALINEVNTALANQTADVDKKIADLTKYVDDSIAAIINNSIQVQDPVMAGIINNPTSQSRVALNNIYKRRAYEPINIKEYGAIGDGVTIDTVAIQAALDAAALTTPPRAVTIPAGTFIGDIPAGQDYMFKVYPGTVISGFSRFGSVIKVKNAAGNYRSVFAGATTATDLSNVVLENFTIDQNNTNNPVSSGAVSGPLFNGFPRYAFYAPSASNVTLRRMTVRDIDAVNTFVTTANNNRVEDCLFTNIGTSPNFHDYSTLYMSGNKISVRGNIFEGVVGSNGARTAIETHSGSQSVHDNHINGFLHGMNITGIQNTGPLSNQIDVHDNLIIGCNQGIALWAQAGGMRNVNIHDNDIIIDHDQWIKTAADFAQGIYLDPGNTTDITNLNIRNNNIEFLASLVTAQASELNAAGIAMYLISTTVTNHNVRIENNRINKSMSCGIRLASKIDNLRIKNNEIIDSGSSLDAGMAGLYKTGILLVGASSNDISIEDNHMHDTRTPNVMNAAISLSGVNGTVRLVSKRNRITAIAVGVTIPPISGSSTALYFEEEMDVYAGPPNAVVGSRMRDMATGNSYVQTTAPNGATWTLRAL